MSDLQQLLQSVKAAASVYAVDLISGKVLADFNSDAPFPAASTNKIPVVLYTLHQVGEGNLKLNDKLSVAENILQGSGVIKDLSHTEYTLADLIYLTLTISDNSAAKTLVQKLGAKSINDYLGSLGFTQTGLKLEGEKFVGWGMTTAKEQARLMQKIYTEELLREDLNEYLVEVMKKCEATSRLGRYVNVDRNREGYIQVAYKGGTLPTVRNAAAIVFSEQPFALSILLKDLQSTGSEADEVMSKVVEMFVGGSDRMTP